MNKEHRTIIIWAVIGAFIGLAITPEHAADQSVPIFSMALGAMIGYALVLRLRWRREQ
jgi:uncharacterized membrane protein YjfL (UPF0719 family)